MALINKKWFHPSIR